jgi:hypothetical protein
LAAGVQSRGVGAAFTRKLGVAQRAIRTNFTIDDAIAVDGLAATTATVERNFSPARAWFGCTVTITDK